MIENLLKGAFSFYRFSVQWAIIVGAIMLFTIGSVTAQNLVPNPGFESMTSCPTGLSSTQITGVTLWTCPTTGSSDYYNSCATGPSGVSTPANDFGTQTPHSGQAYAGFILRPINNYREYLEIPLTSPLVAGASYNVSFYVSLSDVSQWGIDKIGAYLSVGSVGPVANDNVLSFVPQITNPAGNFITDKSSWTLVSGTYVALGGETHLVIGNFSDNISMTTVTGLGGFYPGSYYYIDDASVSMAPSAATVSVSGRVVTSGGKGIAKVTVTMNDEDGTVHRALTNPFGYYRFDHVAAGTTVFMSVNAKGRSFGNNPRVVTVADELAEVNFVSAE